MMQMQLRALQATDNTGTIVPMHVNSSFLKKSNQAIPLEELRLSKRPYNWLKKAGVNSVGQLLSLTRDDLLSIQNLGRTSVEEILDKLNLFLNRFQKESNTFEDSTDEVEIMKRLNRSIQVLNLSFRASRVLKEMGIFTVKQLILTSRSELYIKQGVGEITLEEIKYKLGHYLVEKYFDFRKQDNRIANKRKDTISWQEINYDNIEGLIESLMTVLKVREKAIIESRFGLDGGRKKTLEEVGKQLRVTRERVRQIEKKAVSKLTINSVTTLRIRQLLKGKAIDFLSENNNFGRRMQILSSFSNGSSTDTLLESYFGLINKVFFYGKFFDDFFELEKDLFCLDKETQNKFKKVLTKAEKILLENNHRCVKDVLVHEVKVSLKYLALTDTFIANVISQTQKIDLVNEIYRLNLPRLKNKAEQIEKALNYIGQPAHFTQIALVINKIFPEQPKVSQRYVHAVLTRKKEKFVWLKPGVYGLTSWNLRRPPYIKDCLVLLLKKAGKPMHIDFLKEHVLKNCNCSETSIIMTLDLNNNLFKKYSKDFYGLVNLSN